APNCRPIWTSSSSRTIAVGNPWRPSRRSSVSERCTHRRPTTAYVAPETLRNRLTPTHSVFLKQPDKQKITTRRRKRVLLCRRRQVSCRTATAASESSRTPFDKLPLPTDHLSLKERMTLDALWLAAGKLGLLV